MESKTNVYFGQYYYAKTLTAIGLLFTQDRGSAAWRIDSHGFNTILATIIFHIRPCRTIFDANQLCRKCKNESMERQVYNIKIEN